MRPADDEPRDPRGSPEPASEESQHDAPGVLEPDSAASAAGSARGSVKKSLCPDKGELTPDERKWKHELAELRQLVIEQQYKVHCHIGAWSKQLDRLHGEQEKQLQEAISRVETLAPWGAPVIDLNGIAQPAQVGVDDKLESRVSHVKSEVSARDTSRVREDPPSRRSSARDSSVGPLFKQGTTITGPVLKGQPSMISAEAALHHSSDDMTKSKEVSAATLKEMFMGCWDKCTRFLQIARSHYASPRSETSLHWLVNSIYFRAAISIAILVNGLCIGFQVDDLLKSVYRGQTPGSTSQQPWYSVEIVFCTLFTLELVLRAAAERGAFVLGSNWSWNLFDFFLVSSQIVGLIFAAAPNFSFARILRLFRFTRVLRILRAMRSYESLRVMVFSILSSMTSLLWVFLLLLFMIYFFAVFFATVVVDYFETEDVGSRDNVLLDLTMEHFSSVMGTILSLFMCISGGIDWSDVMEPLKGMSGWYVMVFVIYIFFMAFGVLNVVVGHFVDNAQRASQKDRESVVKNELRQEKEYGLRMRNIFREADKDHDGQLSWEEFEEYLSNGQAAAYFSTLGLDVTIARTLFELLDVDDTDQVGIEEFVGGCMRLRGSARSIDVNMLLYETEKICYKLTEFMQDTSKGICNLELMMQKSRKASPVPPVKPPGTADPYDNTSEPGSVRNLERASSGLSRATTQLREFRRRPARPCAEMAGASLSSTTPSNHRPLDL